MNQYFDYQEDTVLNLWIHTIVLIKCLRTWTSSRIPDNEHEVRPVRKVRCLNRDQSPLENCNFRTKLASITRSRSDRKKEIKSTYDDSWSFNQPKTQTNKPSMIDEPSNWCRKQFKRSRKILKKPPPSSWVQISTATFPVCTKHTQKILNPLKITKRQKIRGGES